ncbi:MAG: HAD-IA family hydrolase [Gemmatimonadetes bacterium]|nr:HAD-IA family hydrolase [Gemmatimonadota bacterium]
MDRLLRHALEPEAGSRRVRGGPQLPAPWGHPVIWSAVLFDLDGTLADTTELILRCYRHTMRVHLGHEPPDERWMAGMGTPLREQLKEFARDADEAARMAETYSTYQRAIHDDMVKPFPGTVEVVRALKGMGSAVGVVTSRRTAMAQRTLSRAGFDGVMDVLVGADDVGKAKPDPEPVLLALERLGLAGREARTLFVGDSPFDIRAGKGAGTHTAAVLWGPFPHDALAVERPDHFVSHPDELLELRP